jgi:hypothetical protein
MAPFWSIDTEPRLRTRTVLNTLPYTEHFLSPDTRIGGTGPCARLCVDDVLPVAPYGIASLKTASMDCRASVEFVRYHGAMTKKCWSSNAESLSRVTVLPNGSQHRTGAVRSSSFGLPRILVKNRFHHGRSVGDSLHERACAIALVRGCGS